MKYSFFCKSKKYTKGYIDRKRPLTYDFNGLCVDTNIRYSEYLPIKDVMQHLYRLNEYYEVNLYKGTYYKETEKLDIGPLQRNEDNEISSLKSKMQGLKNTLDYWKDKFEKLISFLYDKLHSWYDKDDKYIDVVNDMYDDKVLDDDDVEELDLSKEKDDFER